MILYHILIEMDITKTSQLCHRRHGSNHLQRDDEDEDDEEEYDDKESFDDQKYQR